MTATAPPATPAPRPRPARLSPLDVIRTGGYGLRTRPVRVFLSALGIAIGIAAMTGVVGISTSSTEELDRKLDALGTNLLTVAPGETLGGGQAHLPAEATAMIGDIAPVQSVSAIGLTDARIYRNDHIPAEETGGIGVYAARTDLPATVGAHVTTGRWLNTADTHYPTVVLGPDAAAQLGVHTAGPEVQLWLGERWFTVIGLLAPTQLAPELDTAALIGWPAAQQETGFNGHATTIYTRTDEAAVTDVQAILGATANPQEPTSVNVSRPSDALVAKEATDTALNGLLLGLGAIALLIGGIGIANTMVISVLERRPEIGLRRSLGATRGQIRTQFLCESLLLSTLGGTGGVLLGIGATAGYATHQGWPTVVPLWAITGSITATLTTGTLAGLYPAIHAARQPPTQALTTT